MGSSRPTPRIGFIALLIFCIGPFVYLSYFRLGEDSPKKTPSELMLVAPEYDTWPYCSGDATRVCFNDSPLVANQNVIEYLNSKKEKKILIWGMLERNDKVVSVYGEISSFQVDKVRMSFFIRQGDHWKLIGQSNFLRSESPKNENIPIFDLDSDSLIVREFISIMVQRGKNPSEIEAPTIAFTGEE